MISEALWYIISHWPTSFLLTLAVEVPLFVVLTRGTVPVWRAAGAGALGSCLTHPLLWFVWRQVVSDYLRYAISGEVLVVVTESLTFFALARPLRLSQAVAVSCIANGASWGAGLLIYWYCR